MSGCVFPVLFWRVIAHAGSRGAHVCSLDNQMLAHCYCPHTGVLHVSASGIETSGKDNFCCAACVTSAPRARLEEAMWENKLLQ